MRALIQWLRQAGINSDPVLTAMQAVPRDQFVTEELKPYAYEDEALPIECGQTISQPFVIACMTAFIITDNPLNKVLEVGTGSGYQSAILSQLFKEVYTVERIKTLLELAEARFEKLKYSNIHTHFGDGHQGWQEYAPYNAIIVTAAAPEIPQALLDQMIDGGRMIIPVGIPNNGQRLQLVKRKGDHYDIDTLDPVVFVPMLRGQQD